MTYKEAITNAMNINLPKLGLSEVLISFAMILMVDADQRLTMDYPQVTIGNKQYSGKKTSVATTADLLQVLNGNDFMRSFHQSCMLSSFLNWFLDQEVDEKDELNKFKIETIAGKWNEFAINQSKNYE